MKILGARAKKPIRADEIFKKVETYRKEKDVFLQLFDSRKVVGKEHLLWAYQKAEEVFESGANRADTLEMETLLWASGEWQIKDAIETMGIKDEAAEMALMIEKDEDIFLDHMDWERDDTVLNPSIKKLKNFGIRDDEIDSVDEPFDLVFEKMTTSVL